MRHSDHIYHPWFNLSTDSTYNATVCSILMYIVYISVDALSLSLPRFVIPSHSLFLFVSAFNLINIRFSSVNPFVFSFVMCCVLSASEYDMGICWYSTHTQCHRFRICRRDDMRATIPQGEFMWIMWLSRVLYKESLRISYLYSMAHIQCFFCHSLLLLYSGFIRWHQSDIGCGIVVTFATCTRTPALARTYTRIHAFR